MNCTQVEKLKEAYVAGVLTPALYLECAVHVADCADCRRVLALARAHHLHQRTAATPSRRADLPRPPARTAAR